MTNDHSLLTSQQARIEAERCLYCFDAPCMHACPAHIDIPGFISMIKSGNVRGAAETVRTANALVGICGSVCPEEVYCQSVCNRTRQDKPILIRELHHFATQTEVRLGRSPMKKFPVLKEQIAVVGGGPAGLSCAFELKKFGYGVTVFDRQNPGGVPKNSIPPFRLPGDELSAELKVLSRFFTHKTESVDDARLEQLRKEFRAVFLAVGLGHDRPIGIKGEQLAGVHPVLRFLEDAKRNPAEVKVGSNVVVVGGGNVSLDAAATAKRCGASQVVLIYRRSEKEMRVWKSELEEARAQGVEIRFLTNPVQIVGEGSVSGVVCVRTRLSDRKDSSGRLIPVEVEGSSHVLPADTVIVAIGQEIRSGIFGSLKRTPKGFIAVDEKFRTSGKGVFAGGDAISGEGTIVLSVAHGKQVAHAIHEYIGSPASGKSK
jgi:dihydropyrimidine dehydrogenase (NAD+) subunit PreT